MMLDHELKTIFDALTGKDKSKKIDPLTNKYVSAKCYAVSLLYKTF
jgi:hypothetical protein